MKQSFCKSLRLLFLLILQSFAVAALAQLKDDPKNDIFGPEMYAAQKEDLITSMNLDIYSVKAPLKTAVAYQISLIDSIAASLSLPGYAQLFATVINELECSNKFESEPKMAALVCEDKYCSQCSPQRREFYNYLKFKVFISERGLISVGYGALEP